MEKVIATLADLEAEAARLVGELTPRTSATLVTLTGELGAGKTAFVKAIAEALGVADTVTSPTFVLEKIYLLPEGKNFRRLIHIDAYRLSGGHELAPLGFDELMRDSGNLIFLEWPERVADALRAPAVRVAIAVRPDEARTISYG